MARSVTFNGITKFRPGGITKINTDALNQVGISASGTVGLIGESTEGEPGSSAGLVVLNDPSQATALYGAGPLVDAIRQAFQSSGDPLIPGGASEVVVYKTNATTQASVTTSSTAWQLLISSAAVGAGTTTTLIDTAQQQIMDDFYVGLPMILRPFTATAEISIITAYNSSTQTWTVAPAFSIAPADTDEYLIMDDTVPLLDTVDTSSTTTVINLANTSTLVDDELIGRRVMIADNVSSADLGNLRDIIDNDASSITVSPALSSAPTQGDLVSVLPYSLELTSEVWGMAGNDDSADFLVDYPDVDGESFIQQVNTSDGSTDFSASIEMSPTVYIQYVGAGVEIADVVDTGSVQQSNNNTLIPVVTGGWGLNDHTNKQARVIVDGEYIYRNVTVHGTDNLILTPALPSLPEVGAAIEVMDLWVSGDTTTPFSLAWVSGAQGRATRLQTRIVNVSSPSTAHPDNLDIVIDHTDSLTELKAKVVANKNYVCEVAARIDGDNFLACDLDFGNGVSINAENIAQVGRTINNTDVNLNSGLSANTRLVFEYFRDTNVVFDAIRTSAAAGSLGEEYDGGFAPAYSGYPLLGGDNFLRNTGDVYEYIASGGARGVSANSDFQTGFDAMLTRVVNYVVPLVDQDQTNEGFGSTTTWASVAAQLVDHVSTARGAAGLERGGFIGFSGTKSEIVAAANSINDQDVQLTCQNPTVLNATGTLVEQTPRMYAVMASSMRSGVQEVGEPLTHKYIATSSVTQDSSWNPSDLTDSTDLIKAGVLFSETIPGQGTRWVRDLTTWVKDDNLAFAEGSVRDVVRYVAYNLRIEIENRFTGRKAKPATIAAIKDVAASLLEVYRGDDIIVDSVDPLTGATIRAYHNLKVFSSGDIVKINVGIFPVPGINFQLNEIFLQLPTQSA